MRIVRCGILAFAAVAASGAGPQEAPGATVPIEKRGPPLGAIAPEIRLQDQSGREQTLATLSGKNGLVLLFVRSADW
jgi:cytochrome oxidase Cu insertion factor (SCO1/SenC/PrrC family)